MQIDHFYDYLQSELRSLDLFYVIKPNIGTNFQIDLNQKEKHKFKVRDIIKTELI